MAGKRSSFSGTIGFVLAAAGSAVGLGNIWRFPYLAAKDGGGLFLLVYLILAVTFGFTLLTTELAIGRKTRRSSLSAYRRLNPRFKNLGILALIIPMVILPYYSAVGGWVMKYTVAYLTGNGAETATDGYFNSFISSETEPLIYTILFMAATAYVVYRGVNKGIESSSKILMPILLLMIVGIAIFSMTFEYTSDDGVTRSGLDGLKVFVIPDFTDLTLDKLSITIMDAIGQLFFSLSVATGIMITYGSYVKSEDNLIKSINKIEIFDTLVAFLAGMMIIPVVFVFMGQEGMNHSGPGLMFICLPKIFASMGTVGTVLGAVFFTMVLFAALTSAISMMEGIVASFIDKFGYSRRKSTAIEFVICAVVGILVCFGYNILYFELPLPNGVTAQILDLLDYISNNMLMPLLALLTCVLVGWITKPKKIIDEITLNGEPFTRKGLFIVMVKYIAPLLLILLLFKSVGVF